MKKINVVFLSLLVFGILSFGFSAMATEPETELLVVCESGVSSDQQVNSDCVTPPQNATISATKIVCDNESDLPNWGLGGEDINSDTASNFLEGNNNCHLEDWTFEWSADGVGNPGDNVITGGDSWNTFTDTAIIPVGARIWVREQMDGDYIPFTYGDNNDNSNNVSAEFYCSTDVLNYDNWDWIDPVVAGETYHCVGFNVLKEEPKQCDVVSDETNIIEDGSSAVETYNYSHPTWFDESLLGGAAKWIWETFKVVDPTVDTTKVFVKKFNLDSTPTIANIEVASDNGFLLEINDIVIANEIATENNFGAVKSYDVLSSLNSGTENTIRMTVKNFALADSTPESNPAGALYKLHITDSSCSDIPDMCLNMSGYQTKIPEGYERDARGNCTESLACNPNVNLLTNGGFEEPIVINSKKWDTFASGTPNLGWLVEWISGGIGGLELQAGVYGWLPYEANQYAELDSTNATKISQDVPTISGKTYKLEFAYSPRPYVLDNSIEVYADGNLLDTLLSNGTSNSNTAWNLKSYEFTADDETNIEFKDISQSDSFGGYLDNVGLYCQKDLPVVDDNYICSDGLDNDGDGFVDGQDPGCDNENDNDETNSNSDPEPTDLCPNIEGNQEVMPSGKTLKNGNCINRQTSGSIPQGRVLGASTEEGRVLGESTSCGIYLNKYIKLGDKNNDKEEVKKLQLFLNEYLGLKLDVDGFYGLKTYNAVKAFQLKHQNEVLSPWVGVGKLKKENDPTGYVYKTTQRWINMIKCPELNLPIPELI